MKVGKKGAGWSEREGLSQFFGGWRKSFEVFELTGLMSKLQQLSNSIGPLKATVLSNSISPLED